MVCSQQHWTRRCLRPRKLVVDDRDVIQAMRRQVEQHFGTSEVAGSTIREGETDALT